MMLENNEAEGTVNSPYYVKINLIFYHSHVRYKSFLLIQQLEKNVWFNLFS